MKLHEILKDFEQSITKTGLPKPPKLSELLPSEESVKEVGMPNSYPDGMDITPQTKPGWYRIGNDDIYISNFDIPPKVPISGGSKRGTVDITPPPRKWRVGEPSTIPPETVKVVYSGTNRELKKTSKPIKYTDTIDKPKIERR